MATISIIIPVYNVELYLSRCLDSIIAQSFTDWECILVDDGSPDQSGAICDEYACKDSRFKVIHQDNSGPSVARNVGIEHATLENILFVDSDDFIEQDHLKNLAAGVIPCKKGVVLEGIIVKYNDRKETNFFNNCLLESASKVKELIDTFKVEDLGYSVCKLYNRSVLIDYNIRFEEKVRYGEDLLFFLDYIKYAEYANFLSTATYHYIKPNTVTLSNTYREFPTEFEGLKLYCNYCYCWQGEEWIQKNALIKKVKEFFDRSLKCTYRAGANKVSLYQRISNLCKIRSYLIYIERNSYSIPNRIALLLLQYRLYVILDLYMLLFVK